MMRTSDDREAHDMGNPLANLDLQSLYSQLSGEQRASVAQQFIQGFQGSNNPMAQQFAQMDPNQVSAQDLAAMHQHASQEHHGLFGAIMHHPILTAALGGFGIYEVDKHLGRQ
jgi:hypothetical protein